MDQQEILNRPGKVLTQAQRAAYFETGYLLLDGFIGDDWMQPLLAVTDTFIEQSRQRTKSDGMFDLEPDHTAEAPRLRRLSQPVEHHDVFKRFAFEGPIVDLAEDLLGPDVKYHHSKLNFKWADGGEEVKWHQDIQFWPHTNYSPLTIGVYLDEVDDEMGPMGVIPGSHEGELFNLYSEAGDWTGAIREADLPRVATDKAVYLKGRRGSVTVHNCRMVHGSQPNRSHRSRPLLLHTYAAADALTVTNLVAPFPARRQPRARQAGAVDPLRSPALPEPAELVQGLYLDLRPAAGGGRGRRFRLKPGGHSLRPAVAVSSPRTQTSITKNTIMSGLLDGIVVVDFTQVLAGPACTRLMAEAGAEVIKIELAPGGDLSRGLPFIGDRRSGYFCQQNQGKQSLCLDLRRPEALDIAKRLLARADVMIENYSPGAIARLGLDWATVHALNPRLVMCSISAFGQDGPLADLPGFDNIAQALSGATSMIGEADGVPAVTGFAIGDVGTGITALAAISMALFRRERDGKGRYLDVSLLDFYINAHEINLQVASLAGAAPVRAGRHHPAVSPMGIYRAGDGFITLVVVAPMWPRLCQAMGRPELEHDPRFADNPARVANMAALTVEIEAWMASQPGRDAVLAVLGEARVPAAPVLSIEEVMRHPHMLGRGSVRELDDPVLGRFQVPGSPIRVDGVQAEIAGRAPFLGEHNHALLSRHLGLADTEIASLEAAGVLRSEPLPAL